MTPTEEAPMEIVFRETMEPEPPPRSRRWLGLSLLAMLAAGLALGGMKYCGIWRTTTLSAATPRIEFEPVTELPEEPVRTVERKVLPNPPAGTAPRSLTEAEYLLRLAREAEAADPSSGAVHYARLNRPLDLARLEIRSGIPWLVRSGYLRRLRIDPGDAEALRALARMDLSAGNLDLATGWLERLVRLRANPNAWYNLGNLYARRGEPRRACDAWRRAVELQPTHAWASFNLAVTLDDLGDRTAAAAALAAVSTDDPDVRALRSRIEAKAVPPADARSLGAAASGLEESGDFEGARALLDRAIESAPTDAALRHQRGFVHQRLGNLEFAADDYRAAIAADPQRVESRFNLGTVCEASGKWVQALEAYRDVLRLRPGHVGALNNIGVLCWRVRDYRRAAELFRNAVLADPAATRCWLNLAWTLLALDDKEEAASALRNYLARTPAESADPAARAALHSLTTGE